MLLSPTDHRAVTVWRRSLHGTSFCMYLGIALVLQLMGSSALAQGLEWQSGTYLSVAPAYMDSKDALNHGFVLRGPDLVIEAGIQKLSSNRYASYSFSLGGGGKTTLDTWGFRWAISPVNLAYAPRLVISDQLALYLGPAFWIDYEIQNFPDMHSGHLNWMTNYSFGLHVLAMVRIRGRVVRIRSRTAAVSMTSRPETDREAYYFSLRPGDILADAHSNMDLRFPTGFLATTWSAGHFVSSRTELAYELKLARYADVPRYTQLSSAIRISIYFGRPGTSAQ